MLQLQSFKKVTLIIVKETLSWLTPNSAHMVLKTGLNAKMLNVRWADLSQDIV